MRVVAVLAVLLSLVVPAQGTHVPCPPEDCPVLEPIPAVPLVQGAVEVVALRVDVDVVEGVATTALELQLRAKEDAEATLSIPMPGGASLLAFNLTVGSVRYEGRVEERAQARAEYEEARDQGQDAALLELARKDLVRLTVHVPAGEDRVLRAAYAELVPRASGDRIYRFPFSQAGSAGTVALDFRIEAVAPIDRLRFLGLTVQQGEQRASFEGPGPVPDFVAAWREPSGWSASLVASAAVGNASTWVAQVCAPSERPLARDVVFVLDRSGSMSGEKITQAIASLRTGMAAVTESDRFDVVTFSDHVDAIHDELISGPAPAGDMTEIANVMAGGGTDIDGGLQRALEILGDRDSPRLPMVVFVTDGLPSVGITDHDAIIERFIAGNARNAVIEVVPIGLDADQTFLADLALRSGGRFTAVDPEQPGAQLRLQRIYDVVGHVVLRNVTVEVDGIDGLALLPSPLPVVYEDGCLELFLAGTAQPGGRIVLRVAGTAMGQAGQVPASAEFSFTADFVPVVAAVEGLWGAAHVEQLLSAERVEGSSAEARAAIIADAIRLRQLTPYTAWVITAVETAPDSGTAATSAVVAKPTPGFAGGAGGDTTATPGLPAVAALAAGLGAALVRRRRR